MKLRLIEFLRSLSFNQIFDIANYWKLGYSDDSILRNKEKLASSVSNRLCDRINKSCENVFSLEEAGFVLNAIMHFNGVVLYEEAIKSYFHNDVNNANKIIHTLFKKGILFPVLEDKKKFLVVPSNIQKPFIEQFLPYNSIYRILTYYNERDIYNLKKKMSKFEQSKKPITVEDASALKKPTQVESHVAPEQYRADLLAKLLSKEFIKYYLKSLSKEERGWIEMLLTKDIIRLIDVTNYFSKNKHVIVPLYESSPIVFKKANYYRTERSFDDFFIPYEIIDIAEARKSHTRTTPASSPKATPSATSSRWLSNSAYIVNDFESLTNMILSGILEFKQDGTIYKSSYAKIKTQLKKEDIFDRIGYFYFLSALANICKFVPENVGGWSRTWELNDKLANAFFSDQSIAKVLMLSAWINLSDFWSEAREVPFDINSYNRYGIKINNLRRIVLDSIYYFCFGQGQGPSQNQKNNNMDTTSIDEFFKFMRRKYPFLNDAPERTTDYGYGYEGCWKHIDALKCIRRILVSLFFLGIIDVSIEGGTESTAIDLKSKAKIPNIRLAFTRIYSEYDTANDLAKVFPVNAFRLNEIGVSVIKEFLSEKSDKDFKNRLSIESEKKVTKFVVQPNGDVIVPANIQLEIYRKLTLFSKPLQLDKVKVLKIDKDTIFEAVCKGISLESIKDFLMKHSEHQKIPPIITHTIQDLERKVHQLTIHDASFYIHAEDPILLKEIMSKKKFQKLFNLEIHDKVGIIKTEASIASAKSELRKSGYLVFEEDEKEFKDLDDYLLSSREGQSKWQSRWSEKEGKKEKETTVENITKALLEIYKMAARQFESVREINFFEVSAQKPEEEKIPTENELAEIYPELKYRGMKKIDLIETACKKKLKLSIKYVNFEGRQSERIIEPKSISGSLVKAFCHLRGDDRVFSISRITYVEVVTDATQPSSKF